MAYCTQQDLIDRFTEARLLQIADADNDETLDADRITKAITDAAALIDSYLGVVYDLPLASTPEVLAHTNADMAFFRLHEDAPEAVKDANKAAIDWLKNVSAGRAKIDIGGDVAAPAGNAVQFSGPEPVFTRDKLKGF